MVTNTCINTATLTVTGGNGVVTKSGLSPSSLHLESRGQGICLRGLFGAVRTLDRADVTGQHMERVLPHPLLSGER